MKMIELSSGKPLGIHFTPGQRALIAVLFNLPPHRFDRDNPNHVLDCIRAVDLAPDDVLSLLADIIEGSTIKERPRIQFIESWVSAAVRMNTEIAEMYERRTKRIGSWLKPEESKKSVRRTPLRRSQ
jgi:hypothetical protein